MPTAHVPLATLVLLGLLAQAPAPSTSGSASLRGRVVASNTGTPVRQAGIQVQTGTLQWTTTTDDDGRFVIPDLPAGRYTVRVTKAGFVTWLFGRDRAGAQTRVEPLELKPAEKSDRGDLRLPRGGVIAGRIVDAFGEAVVGTDVRALRYEFLTPGEGRFGYVRHAATNDLGEYRIYGLPPGRYFVGVGMAVADLAERIGQSGGTIRVVPSRGGMSATFYPDTASVSDATPVAVEAGGEIRGIDFAQLAVPLATLAGSVTNERGQPASGVVVMLNPARRDGVLLPFPSMVEPDAGGRFSMANIPPGDYRLDIVSKARLEAIGTTGSSAARPAVPDEFASVPITVAGQDIEDTAIRTARGFDVAGRLVVEGGFSLPPTANVSVSSVTTLRRRAVTNTFLGSSASVQPDGRFVLNGVAGGQLVRAYGLPAGWTLKAVRLNGADVTDEGFDVAGPVRSLEVVVTPEAPAITGSVRDSNGVAVKDYAAVIVFSDDPRRWTLRLTRFVTSAKPGPDGQFAVAGLPPGNYLAAVVDILEPDWPSPDSLESLRRTATPFTLSDGETKTLTLGRKR